MKKIIFVAIFLIGIVTTKAQSFSIKTDSIAQLSGTPNALRVYAHLTLVPSSVAKVEIFFSEFDNCLVSVGGGEQTITSPSPTAPVFITSTFQITKTGNYYARCTGYDDKGNYNFSTNIIHIFVNKIITGTPEIEMKSFFVYPNPTQNTITVPDSKEYFIVNTSGEIVQTSFGQNNTIDVSALPAGLYILQTDKGRARFQKL